jgi:hypothetical protein
MIEDNNIQNQSWQIVLGGVGLGNLLIYVDSALSSNQEIGNSVACIGDVGNNSPKRLSNHIVFRSFLPEA